MPLNIDRTKRLCAGPSQSGSHVSRSHDLLASRWIANRGELRILRSVLALLLLLLFELHLNRPAVVSRDRQYLRL